MTPSPTPTQIAEWRDEFERRLPRFLVKISRCGLYEDHITHDQWQGYLRARTEQATEIAELKAKLAGAEAEIAALKQGLHRADEKLADLMPLAKFGAMVIHFEQDAALILHEDIEQLMLKSSVLLVNAVDAGGLRYLVSKSTIEQLLKD